MTGMSSWMQGAFDSAREVATALHRRVSCADDVADTAGTSSKRERGYYSALSLRMSRTPCPIECASVLERVLSNRPFASFELRRHRHPHGCRRQFSQMGCGERVEDLALPWSQRDVGD